MAGPYTNTAVTDVNVGYPDNPWSVVDQNVRQYYDPVLIEMFRKKNVYTPFTTFTKSLLDPRAESMTITSVYDVHPNFDQTGFTDIWLTSSHIDSRNLQVTFNRYSGKLSYNKFNDYITYWQKNGTAGLARIVGGAIGVEMTQVHDLLSRNAFLQLPFVDYGTSGSGATDFTGIGPTDILTTDAIDMVHLQMSYRDVPYASDPSGNVGTIVGIVSPSTMHDLQKQSDPKEWLYPVAYGDPTRLLNYEVGLWHNVRWVKTPKATLFNCGVITQQTTVTSPIAKGDGAPDPATTKVDKTWFTGQKGSTHFIQLASGTDMSVYTKDMWVSLHRQRTNAYGIANGCDFLDGTKQDLRINSVNAGAHQLTFTTPVMTDFLTDLGGSVYGYVTLATHINSCVFIGGPDAIVCGVSQPPMFYNPQPFDDTGSMYRTSWDAYEGYQTFNPVVAHVVFTGGTIKYAGITLQSGT